MESDPRPKTRVGGLRTPRAGHARHFPPQALELHQATVTTSSTSASGVVEWLSNDPIGISGGLNQYAFCRNNPVNYVDPFGLYLKNDSDYWVVVKPEKTGLPPTWVAPHTTYPGDIDGVKPPAWGGQWYKVKGNRFITTDIQIDALGFPSRVGGVGRIYSDKDFSPDDSDPGRKDCDFEKRHGDWKVTTPDPLRPGKGPYPKFRPPKVGP